MAKSIEERVHEALEECDLCWWDDVDPADIAGFLTAMAVRGLRIVDNVTFADEMAGKIQQHLVKALCKP